MQEEEYTDIKLAVEEAGFFTTFQPFEDDEVWIVLASHRTEGVLDGNSFRVSLKGGRWYLVTWALVYYLVPPGADLTALCLDCLRVTHKTISQMPAKIVSRYQLVEISEEEYDRA